MDPKTESYYYSLAIQSIPNGSIYYNILTEYIREKYKMLILSEEFMNDIFNKINNITNDILSDKIFGCLTKEQFITCGQYFHIDYDENILHIEIIHRNINDYICSTGGIINIPINLTQSIYEIRDLGAMNDKIDEITDYVNRQILNKLKLKYKNKSKHKKYKRFK